MMPADIEQGIAKDAQENLDGLDVVNVPTYGGSAPWYVGQTTEGLLEGVIRYQMYLEDSVAHDPEPTSRLTGSRTAITPRRSNTRTLIPVRRCLRWLWR